MKLPHIILAGEFNFESAFATIISNASNPEILNFLPRRLERLDAMYTSTHPIPAACAPMKITIHVWSGHCLDLKETTLRRPRGLDCVSGLQDFRAVVLRGIHQRRNLDCC